MALSEHSNVAARPAVIAITRVPRRKRITSVNAGSTEAARNLTCSTPDTCATKASRMLASSKEGCRLLQSSTVALSSFSANTSERADGSPRWLRAVSLGISILVLPLASWSLWWVEMRSFIQTRGHLNVEYLFLFAVALLYPGWKMASVLTAELLIALVEPIAHLYYFSPSDALFSLGYLRYIPVGRLLLYLGMVLAYAAACMGILQVGLGKQRSAAGSRTLALTLCLCGTLAGMYDIGQDASCGCLSIYEARRSGRSQRANISGSCDFFGPSDASGSDNAGAGPKRGRTVAFRAGRCDGRNSFGAADERGSGAL